MSSDTPKRGHRRRGYAMDDPSRPKPPGIAAGYRHAEAFCLMRYRDRAGNLEVIWNSRDGVTPFIVRSRAGLEAQHVDWQLDRCDPYYQPPIGSRVFVDLEPERARDHARKYVGRYREMALEMYGSEEEAIEAIARSDMSQPGQPDIITVTAEWLEAFNRFRGREEKEVVGDE